MTPAARKNRSAFCLLTSAFADRPEHVSDLHIRAILMDDRGQYSRLRRRDLDVDLVGLELDERLADGDLIALLFQPLGDAGVDDRLAHLGDDDVSGHERVSCP